MQQSLFDINVQKSLVTFENLMQSSGSSKVLVSKVLQVFKSHDKKLAKVIDKFKIHHKKKVDIRYMLEDGVSEAALEGVLTISLKHLYLALLKQVDEELYFKVVENKHELFAKVNKAQEVSPNLEEVLFTDLTKLAALGKFDYLIDRDNHLNKLLSKLLTSKRKSLLLVGELGVGKSSLVRLLARKIVNGEVPTSLIGTKVLELDMLQASQYMQQGGSSFPSFFETIVKKGGDVIFFVDNLEILGGGFYFGISGGVGLPTETELSPDSDISKESEGVVSSFPNTRIIGATSNNFRASEFTSPVIKNAWETLDITEINKEDLLHIMKSFAPKLEKFHNVTIKKNALQELVNLGFKYEGHFEEGLPGSLIGYLDEVMASIRSEKTTLKRTSIKLFKNLNRLKQKLNVIGLDSGKQGYEGHIAKLEEEILAIESELNVSANNKIKDVNVVLNKAYIQKSFATKVGVGIGEIEKGEKDMLTTLESRLKQTIIGQDNAISALVRAFKRSGAGLREDVRPIISALFLGPTGVGKTQTAKALAKEVFLADGASQKNFLRLDMSDFSEKHTVARLVGAPPGYVGFSEGGQLTSFVLDNPNSVILFDEIEKADPQVLNILLQIMEEGSLVDMSGVEVDFSHTIILLTSNIGADRIKQKSIGFDTLDSDELLYKDMKGKLLSELKKSLKPELINRMDEIVVFRQLNNEDLLAICDIELDKIHKMLKKVGHKLEIANTVKKELVKEGFSEEYGARPLKRTITRLIADPLSDEIIKNKNGNKIKFKARKGKEGIEFKNV